MPSEPGGHSGRDSNVQPYIVGIIDIMGQKQALERWDIDVIGERAELISALRSTVGTVRAVREAFLSHAEAWGVQALDENLVSQLEPRLADQIRRMAKSEVKIQSFSDTVLIYSPLRHVDGLCCGKDLVGVLGGAGITLLTFLSGGVPIRGAVELGMGTDFFDGEVYGPVLSRAHYLEQTAAQYPRIVAGPRLVSYLEQLSDDQSSPFANTFNAGQSQMCREFLSRDDDGRMIVDYLGEAFQAEGEVTEFYRRAVPLAHKFVHQALRKYTAKGNHDLALKYHRLARYFRSRASRWDLMLDPDEPTG